MTGRKIAKKLYRFAFCGLNLDLPENWDLSRFNGNFERGSIDIEDEEGLVFSCWWRTLDKKDVSGLDEAARVKSFVGRCDCEQFRLERDGISSFRIYQDGSWQNAVILTEISGGRTAMVVCGLMDSKQLLRTVMPLQEADKQWNYELYAIKFTVPDGFKLTECSLVAGCQKFVFMKNNLSLTIWVISLFRRLLEGMTPIQWAMKYIDLNFRKQFRFAAEYVETDRHFAVSARRRKRWLLNLHVLFSGNLCAELTGRILGDQLYLAFFEYRKSADSEIVKSLKLGEVA